MRLPLPPCYPRALPLVLPPVLSAWPVYPAAVARVIASQACASASVPLGLREGFGTASPLRPPRALTPGPPSRPTPGGSARAFQCRLAAPVRSHPVRSSAVPGTSRATSPGPARHTPTPHRTAQAGLDSRTGCPQGSVAAAGWRHPCIPPSTARAARFRIFRDGGEGHLSVPASGVCRPRPGQRVRSADTRATWEDTRWAG